jgi:hypothetical protein
MVLEDVCAPAILFLGFSLTQIVIDLFKNLYSIALIKLPIMIIFTVLLNILCKRGLGIVSWLIVFIPFILMTFISIILLYVFGISPFTEKLNYSVKTYNDAPTDEDKQHKRNKKHPPSSSSHDHHKHDKYPHKYPHSKHHDKHHGEKDGTHHHKHKYPYKGGHDHDDWDNKEKFVGGLTSSYINSFVEI